MDGWMDDDIVAPAVVETMMTPSRNNDRGTSHVLRMTWTPQRLTLLSFFASIMIIDGCIDGSGDYDDDDVDRCYWLWW